MILILKDRLMITVHHLNNSRSQRVLWLLEELGLDYTIEFYQRDSETNLAPTELLEIHPLGKSPVVEVDGEILIESGAIIEIIARKFGGGKLSPKEGTQAHDRYIQLLHYAEGSAMLPMMLRLYCGRLGEAAAPLLPRIASEMANHLSYLDGLLDGQDFFIGKSLTAADIQLSFVVEVANVQGELVDYENLDGFLERIRARPAYKRALEKGGPYAF